jgi:hypothetical protein
MVNATLSEGHLFCQLKTFLTVFVSPTIPVTGEPFGCSIACKGQKPEELEFGYCQMPDAG